MKEISKVLNILECSTMGFLKNIFIHSVGNEGDCEDKQCYLSYTLRKRILWQQRQFIGYSN